jgi:hypothetical protein
MSKQHELKTWPEYFEAIVNGDKTFELRKDDRGFKVGDVLRLREWNPEKKFYSGRYVLVRVKYILKDFGGLQDGYVIMETEFI